MGQACTFGRVKVIDAIQSNKENAFLSEPHHFPEQAVDFVRADDIQTVGGELAATDDISALFWEVEFRNFGLGHFIPLGRPCICNSAITFCNVRRHNFTETFWRMQMNTHFVALYSCLHVGHFLWASFRRHLRQMMWPFSHLKIAPFDTSKQTGHSRVEMATAF